MEGIVMAYLLIRQKFADYGQWRAAFDSLDARRRQAGMKAVVVSVNADDPHEAVVVFEVADAEEAQRHASSDALREAHRAGGVLAETTQITVLRDGS